MAKIKKILEDMAMDGSVKPKFNKREVIESVSGYARIGKSLYNNSNIIEMAEQLAGIVESAHTHIMSETDDWFDKVSINRNMKNLNGMVKEFKKTAMEYNSVGQRLTALYEDMGGVLNRYYEIHSNDEPDGEEAKLQFNRNNVDRQIADREKAKSSKMVTHEQTQTVQVGVDLSLLNLIPDDVKTK